MIYPAGARPVFLFVLIIPLVGVPERVNLIETPSCGSYCAAVSFCCWWTVARFSAAGFPAGRVAAVMVGFAFVAGFAAARRSGSCAKTTRLSR